MSKWINKDLFENFQKEKIEEKDTQTGGGFRRSELLWDTPEKGTIDQAKVYEGRFLPDPKGQFYKKFYYHFWQSGESWIFVLCPKTENFKNYCPFCSAVSKLYGGTQQDKSHAYQLKRKEKFVGNFYVAKDPRDTDRDDENKVVGKVKLYEFPAQVEKKLKNEITDRDEGYGVQIFDPSENGRNFILKVLSTKKQEDGRTWPDYSSSGFARSQSALGSDDDIKELMNQCINLVEYINSMETTKEKQVEILKNEFLWELVEQEVLKNGYEDIDVGSKNEEEEKEEKEEKEKSQKKNEDEPPWDTESESDEKPKESDEKSDEKPKEEIEDEDDLLAELDNM